MIFLKRKPIRLLSLATALSLMFTMSAFAAELNESDAAVPAVSEGEIPVEVGSLVTGTALGVGTVVVKGVNVRENPNLDAAVVKTLGYMEQVVILSREGDWYRVSGEGYNGFVSVEYLSLSSEGSGDLGYAEIKTSGANIRADADTESDTVLSVDEDSVLTITGVSDGWYEVDVDGTTGYIRSDLVDPTADIPAERIYDYVVVKANGINLRSAPDASSEKVDMLFANSRCTLLEQDGDWYKVQYGDKVGYVLASYMSTTNDASQGSTNIETESEAIARQEAEAAAARAAAEAAAAAARARSASSSSSSSGSSSSSSSSGSSSSGKSSATTISANSAGSASSYSGNSSIVSTAYNYLGVPYVWGGTSASGFDCSGFTQYVFARCGYSISRTAAAQYNCGSYVSYSNLSAGDLVFFCNTYSSSGITHVGIYIGGGQFIHAAGSGVKVSSLSESYYSSRYYAACRIA